MQLVRGAATIRELDNQQKLKLFWSWCDCAATLEAASDAEAYTPPDDFQAASTFSTVMICWFSPS